MAIIDNYPNAERTLTPIEASLITDKEYRTLKKISKQIKEDIEKKTGNNINSDKITKYYLEQLIRYSEYPNISQHSEQEIIIANILLPDDIKIAELLNKNGFTKEHLKIIMRFRALLKNIILNSVPIDEEIKRQFTIYKKFVDKLTQLFKTEFNIDDQNIILNRICEMLISCPNYFDTKITEQIKKR